jgi:hypothetical protein
MAAGKPILMCCGALTVIAIAFALAGSAYAADTKECQVAKRKVEREQRSLAAAADLIAHDKHARQTCTSRSVCARYDAEIADTERRSARVANRLARYQAEAAAACS